MLDFGMKRLKWRRKRVIEIIAQRKMCDVKIKDVNQQNNTDTF